MAPMCREIRAKEFEECAHFCHQACFREDISVDVQEHPFAKSKLGIAKEDECRSLIIFSFNRMEVLEYRYSEKYQSVSLFSYIGGYLGLWLGISLVAICDVIETAILIGQWIFQKVHQADNRIHQKGSFQIKSGGREFWII
ncbi:FMRFamide-activated amiloride-sensitive sodium channel [Parasteatoda tepidariorum]|uniref:FMRFamide-activated amiloride-sensitive sodium channel n=1 Tax=Parasteatoda tepidariorum TaxID=114398 RepID=UPI00077FC0C4|nr:FMRFamide-activated amiloride-sensitive sodium channel [Parasteatoda tepidariorum]